MPASPTNSLLIRAGRLIDPASGFDAVADIAVRDGQIVAIAPKLTPESPETLTINAEGLIVTPGLIDPHVHLREPGGERAETIATGTAAAANGGFTAVVCMPNTTPAIDNDTMVRYIHHRAEQTGSARVFVAPAITKARHGAELAELELMAAAGAVGFTDDGDCIASAGMQARALAAIKATGRCLMQHCQEPTLTKGGVMHAGEASVRLGLGGWPRSAEEIIIERDIHLNRAIRCPYHVQHLSSGGSVDIIRRARAAGLPVTAEATPHHLLLTCDLIEQHPYDTSYKMNPPLRESSDIKAIKEGIADGTITLLGTDHAPHPAESKEQPFDIAAFGIIGLDTALPLYIEALVTPGVITLPRLIAMMTIEPARLCGLDAQGLGMLKVGGPADITLFDPATNWTITPSALRGMSHNTPFMNRTVKGRAVATIVSGHLKLLREPNRLSRPHHVPVS
jgi:dihydroorotase